jgi:periplasmic protein CpxP/Spy
MFCVLLRKINAMKNLFLIALLFISLGSFAQATPEERATNQTNRMKTELNLTDDQYTKVYDINLGIIMKNDGIKASTFSEEVKKEVLQSNQQARKSMLKDVLTAAQYEKLETKVKEIKKKKREKAEHKEVKN